MTAPPPCDRLDAYLAGRLAPDDEATFEAHAVTCETCLGAEDAAVGEALARLGAIECPPEVVTAALAQARRQAPDRAPRRGGAFRPARVWAVVAMALLVGIALTIWSGQRRTDEPQVAEVQPSAPAPVPERSPAPPSPEDAALPEAEPRAEAPALDPTPPAPAPRRAPRRAPARPLDAPAPEAVAPQPDLASVDSVAIAREEVYLALAIVADAQDQATSAVTDGVGRVSDALHAAPDLLSPQTP